MDTKNIILKLRTERGMSQDELADKIMVTRQAVSRWENGDTVPNTDTLKLLSKDIPIMTMGPICIKNEYKRKGYGKILLDHSLEKAAELGCGALCFEGNIDFYGKSGFKQASEYGIRYHGLPEGEDASFFLCKELVPGYLEGITGEYAPPEGYLVDEREVEEFDKQFPNKEKKKLPGQIF